MKNIDKIKNMGAWELAEFLYDVSNGATVFTKCEERCDECTYCDQYCISEIGEWLIDEVEKGDGG